MTTITRETSRGQIVALPFAQDAVAASQTDVQLVAPGETTTPLIAGYPMPWAGEVVGMSWYLDTAGTAGALTVGVTVNGTEDADTTQTVTTGTSGVPKFQRGLVRFAAGDILGAEITTNATWDGTASDISVVVYALTYLSGI